MSKVSGIANLGNGRGSYAVLAERFRVPLWTCGRRLGDALDDGLPEVHLVP